MSSLRKATKASTNSVEDEVDQLRRGPWTLEEDSLLVQYIARHGEGRWNLLAKHAGLRRTGKSCRLRWLNYLKPDVKRGNLTPLEQFLILELHSKWGNKWSKIAQHLPGRTDNEIKNYWRTRVQKQARHLKIDANSTAFQNVLQCFWMPRLLQKMEGPTSFSSMASLNSRLPKAQDQTSQPQALTAVQQVPAGSNPIEAVQSLDHHHQQQQEQEQNSDSEHRASSSSESMNNISKMSQFAEYQTTPFLTIGNNGYSTVAKDCYNYVDNSSSCYDMETINLASTLAVVGDFPNPVGDCHLAENNWVSYGFADGIWSMGESWELRSLH